MMARCIWGPLRIILGNRVWGEGGKKLNVKEGPKRGIRYIEPTLEVTKGGTHGRWEVRSVERVRCSCEI